MAIYDPVSSIIDDCAVELGLGAVADAFGATDANIIQMVRLLKRTGRALVREFQWLQNRKEYTFATTGATSYALPSDLQQMIDGTAWNRTARLPLILLSDAAWQQYKATLTGIVLNVLFRPGGATQAGTLELPAVPTSGQTIAFEYRSNAWVSATPGTSAPAKNAPTANDDVVWIEADLITTALKYAFLKAKGFDTSAAQDDLDKALMSVQSANVVAAPILSIDGRHRHFLDRLINESNIPLTGYGA